MNLQTAAPATSPPGVAAGEPVFGAEATVRMEEHAAWPMIARLPVMLEVNVPLRGFKVCHLLSLRTGQSISSAWPVTEDVPLKVGPLQIYWGEFEVLEQRIALRLTRLI